MRPPHARAALLDQAATNEFDGQHPEQRDLRIGREDLVRRNVQRLGDLEPALDP